MKSFSVDVMYREQVWSILMKYTDRDGLDELISDNHEYTREVN